MRIEDENGVVGFGEVAPIPWFGTETLEMAHAYLSHSVKSNFPDDPPAELPCCRFAISCARFLLRQDAVPSAEDVSTCALLPAGSSGLDRLRELVALGFRFFKWKVGVESFEREREILNLMLDALPTSALLRLDANGSWNPTDAWLWLKSLVGEERIEFVEDPLSPLLWEAAFGLRESFETELALDIPITPDLVSVLSRKGWPGMVTLKPSLLGSLEDFLGMHRQFPEKTILSSSLETAFGYESILRLANGEGIGTRSCGFGGQDLFEEDGLKLHPVSPTLRAGIVEFDALEQAWEELRC